MRCRGGAGDFRHPVRRAILADMTWGIPGGDMTTGQDPGEHPAGQACADHAPAHGPHDPDGADAPLRARQAAGRRLRARREAAGLSQLELGRRIGYGRSTIGDAETKGTGAPTLWSNADAELAAGGELVALQAAARAAASAAAAAAGPAGPGRLRVVPGEPPAADGAAGQDAAVISPVSCPHCGCLLVMQTQLSDAVPGPPPAPGRGA